MSSDGPIVDEVRERAMRISARFDDDLAKYTKYLQQRQAEHPSRVVSQITVVPASGAVE